MATRYTMDSRVSTPASRWPLAHRPMLVCTAIAVLQRSAATAARIGGRDESALRRGPRRVVSCDRPRAAGDADGGAFATGRAVAHGARDGGACVHAFSAGGN